MTKLIWTDEMLELLIELCNEGKTQGTIANIFGCTRSTISGKVSRLKMQYPDQFKLVPESNRRLGRGRAHRNVDPGLQAKAAEVVIFDGPPDDLHADVLVLLVDLSSSHCHWPIGDPQKEGFGFCGLKPVPGNSYCAGHRAKAEIPQRQRTSHLSAKPLGT